MSKQQHPDAEELARYQAGEISGRRGRQLAAHVADCASCASVSDELASVSTVLASVPAPPMPDAVESRIMAAISAEAATRQAASPATAGAAGAADSPAANGHRSRRLRLVHSDKSHSRGFRPAMAAVSAAACLLLVGFGYLLSRTGSSSSSSFPASAAAPATAGANGQAAASSAALPAGKAISPPHTTPTSGGQPAIPFLVTTSDINYQPATLGAQVRAELNHKSESSGTGNRSSASTGGLPPSQPLIGCVLHVTENELPELVEQATYEGKAAYVIAVSDYAWVVSPSCTASNPDVITSAAVPG